MRATTLFGVTLLVGIAQAQQKPATGVASPPGPAAELERLKPLDGTWSCKGVAPAGAAGPGSPQTKYTSTFTVQRTWDGFAYNIAYDQKDSKPHFAGAWSVGWDGSQHKLQLFWLDNVGNVGLETASDWNRDALIAQGEGFGPAGPATFRDTFTRKGANAFHWKGELRPHSTNAWMVIGEDDCSK